MSKISRPALVLGCGVRDRNLPGYGLPWRQDSTMLYLVGDPGPHAFAIIDTDGTTRVYRPTPPPQATLWEGAPEPHDAAAARLGVDQVLDIDMLEGHLAGLDPVAVACADALVNQQVAKWLARPLRFGAEPGDQALVDALVALRRTKHPDELAALRVAAAATADAHRLSMAATREGVPERHLHVLFQACLSARACTEGYDTILTQQGEVLHHHGHDGVCAEGRMVLCDGGGELQSSGYGVDVTRTWPVSGAFRPKQRAVYDAVLAAQNAAIDALRPGTRYRAVHDAAATVLAQFLLDEGLLRDVSAQDAVALGAHAPFFPHGVGHLLGLDVHDLESFGDQASYPRGQRRDPTFGASNLRLDLPVEPGWVVTIEPGFYVVPSILGDKALRERLGRAVDWEAAEGWLGFGGVRIEDDFVVREGPPENLTAAIPSSPEQVEACVGTGVSFQDLFPA